MRGPGFGSALKLSTRHNGQHVLSPARGATITTKRTTMTAHGTHLPGGSDATPQFRLHH